MRNARKKAIGIAFLVLIFMSLDTVLIKFALTNVSPYAYVWLSLLISIIALTTYTFFIKKERVPWDLMTKKVWFYIFQILGAGIAFAGLRVFFPTAPQGGEWIGIVLVLAAITGVAYTNNIARKLSIETCGKISNNIISTLAIIFGGSLMIITCIVIDGFPPIVNSGSDWLIFLYTGVVYNAIGLTVWNLVLRTLRSYEASVLGASMVIWTSIFAYFILGETITTHQLIGNRCAVIRHNFSSNTI